MSKETFQWLANNVLAGFSDVRPPWWVRYAEREGFTPNLFPAEVPMERVTELIASWMPYTEPIFSSDMEQITTHKLVRASDTKEILSVVGIDHAIHTYREWLTGTVNECVGDDAQVSSAGLLRNRAQAWVQIERPETAVGPDGIRFSPYVVLSTSLDGSLASQINQNTQMVVCDNTLEIGRNQGLSARVKHTKNSDGKLGNYRGVMSAIMAGETDFREELERELSIEVSDGTFGRFLDAWIPVAEADSAAKKTRAERKRQEITALYNNDDRVAGWKGTMFGVVQAVNTWNQHLSQLKNSTEYEMTDTDLRAMRNYSARLKGNQGRDMETVRVLESVLA